MNRPLGERQVLVLKRLRQTGRWHPRCGWVWSTDLETVKILDSLARRGLVRREPSTVSAGYQYVPVEEVPDA